MRKTILLSGLLLLTMVGFAQQSIVYSQYIFNGLLINPAYAGSHVQLSATLNYRNQWVNFEGSPETTTFSAHSSFLKGRMGLGLTATRDVIGSYKNHSFMPSYALIIKDPITGGALSMGVQAGFNQFNANFDELKLRVEDQDPTFNKYMNEFKFNFGGGLFYYNKRMWAGFSVPTILTHNRLNTADLAALRLPRFYYLTGGIKFPLDPRTKKIWMHPSVLFRIQDGTPLSADINAIIALEDIISLGTSFRSGDGLTSFVNFKLSEKFYVGYSYDWTTSNIRSYSMGSHEIMINYRTRIRKVHQNLDCPHVYSH